MGSKHSIAIVALGLLATPALLAANPEDQTEFRQVYSHYEKQAKAKDYKASLPLAKRALELGEQIYEPTHENLPTLTYNYGWNLVKLKNYKEAKPVLRTALERFEAVYGKDSLKLVPVLMELGDAYRWTNSTTRQRRFYDRALRLMRKHHGRDSVAYAQRSLEAGIAILEPTIDARRYLQDAFKIFEAELGPEHYSTGMASFYLGKLHLGTNRNTKARDHFLLALQSFERPDEPSNTFEMSTHAFLVQAYEKLKQSSEATKHCLAIGRMSPAQENQDYKPLFRVAPSFPASALSRGQEGEVVVEFTVDENGFAKDLTVQRSTNSAFERSALEAVELWRFAPRFENGSAVSTAGARTLLTFSFAD